MNLLSKSGYRSLQTNPQLGKNIFFLTYGGSCPDAIELLGCKSERYFVFTFIGRWPLDQRHMFLFRRVINSFSGYAGQQLRWLDYAAKHTFLPEMPDMTAIQAFRMEVNERAVQNEI